MANKLVKSEKDVLRLFANEIAERITRKTISALQKIKDTLSGDDSELENSWDEICVQVQYGQSFFWDSYDLTARSFVVAYIEELKEHEKLALWFQTDRGLDWLYDDEEERDKYPPVDEDDIAQYVLQDFVYYKAGDWSNKRIQAYLDYLYMAD